MHDSYDHTTYKMNLAVHRDCILKGMWIKNFVSRRELKEGDEIGLLWDESKSSLQVGVISRAVTKPPADEEEKI